MGSERSLWNTLQKNMKGKWEAERIENMVGSGVPDVYFSLPKHRRNGWIELKHAHKWPKKDTTPVRLDHFTAQQRSFFKRHGAAADNVWMLLQVGRDYFLLDWYTAIHIDFTKEQLLCANHWTNRINYDEFIEALTGPF